MKQIKSERLRKLEAELHDLQEWLRLGLVPKKDVTKHKEEIQALMTRIEEEKDRLQFLKDGGDSEEFIAPKRSAAKGAYNDMPTIPDVEVNDSNSGLTEGSFEMHTYISEDTTLDEDTDEEYYTTTEFDDNTSGDDNEVSKDLDDEDDESYFSDKNRWRRGGIVDPDADEW